MSDSGDLRPWIAQDHGAQDVGLEPFPARGSGSEAQLCCSTGSIAGFLERVSPRRPPAHPPESSGQPSPALSVWHPFSQDGSFISQTPRTHLQEASRRTGSSAWQAVAASGDDFKGAPPRRRCEGLSSWSLGRGGTGPRQKPQRLRPLHQDGADGPGSPALGPTGRGTPRLDGRRAGQRHDLGSTACPFLSRRLFSCKRRGWMQ